MTLPPNRLASFSEQSHRVSMEQPTWAPYTVGEANVVSADAEGGTRIRLLKEPPQNPAAFAYTNAQLDDYHQLRRSDFLWRPPLKLSLRACFSHPACTTDAPNSTIRANNPSTVASENYLTGTAGFGFWNDPFMMTGIRWPTLPRAVWFFHGSQPSNMPLALGVPGWGWKAAVIDCLRLPFALLAPTAPGAMLLMRSQRLYRHLWPLAQRVMNVDERMIELSITEWRTYELEWLPNIVRFRVDGTLVFETKKAPRGPLGLVIWLDNQFMVATPTGRIRSGLVASTKQERLEIEALSIVSL